ncbi:hypothetical protein DXT99_14095 [Pontibacter diazotrophicus]|uniref:Uncharacterized protein n=1 Tax=Pontibacter diazotrophicus TaxID=1400979 RepID=A0A3D8LAV9_9BACT|nr:hypothetical protein [Pontibacter diazotrophicus]RDV14528.1 hypothetical protein DXT99_14095 [Pontibacter diazotrophicus]
MEITKVDKKLSRKGWKFMSDSKPSDKVMGKAVWAYSPNPTGAIAWCVLYYNDTSPSRILYNAYAGNAVQKIHKKMRLRKLLPVSEGNTLEGVEQLEYYADYPENKYVLRLLKYQQFGFSGVKIFEKADYEKARENGRL